MKVTAIEIRRPDDFHVHLRTGAMLKKVLPYTADVFGRALVMPNISPPIIRASDAKAYRDQILKLGSDPRAGRPFEPLMTIKLTPGTPTGDITFAKSEGVLAAKLYPDRAPGKVGGEVTTNAGGGIYDYDLKKSFGKLLKIMSDVEMVLCVHAETPDIFVMDRESNFLITHISKWIETFPKLKIVIEHATTARALGFARTHKNVACTITAHHLVLTLDDIIGGRIDPHCFCKPVAKTEEDRKALVAAATGGESCFFFGSDSAPHKVIDKESKAGAAGCFTAPVALPLLAEVFEDQDKLENLEAFVSENGANFYGLPLNNGTVKLEQKQWKYYESRGIPSVRAFWHDHEFRWKVTQ